MSFVFIGNERPAVKPSVFMEELDAKSEMNVLVKGQFQREPRKYILKIGAKDAKEGISLCTYLWRVASSLCIKKNEELSGVCKRREITQVCPRNTADKHRHCRTVRQNFV